MFKPTLLIGSLLLLVTPLTYAATFNASTTEELRVALLTASSNGDDDTINVAPGLYSLTETLRYVASGGENHSLSIIGQDSTTTTLDGGGAFPILRIDTRTGDADPDVNVTISGVTVSNGNTVGRAEVDGAGVHILSEAASVSITASEFLNNQAEEIGGGLFIQVSGPVETFVNLQDLTFDSNRALGTNSGGSLGAGGGAHISASQFTSVNVNDVEFAFNSAGSHGGGLEIEGNDANDAAPLVPAVGEVTLFDVLFRDNAISFDGRGGGADIAASSVQVSTTGFVDNTSSLGGGMHVRDVSTLVMTNTGFVGNQALRQSTAANGGGLFVEGNLGATVTLTNNTFASNTATDLGGAAYLEVGGSTALVQLYNNLVWDSFQEAGDLYVNDDPLGDIAAQVQVFNNNVTTFISECTITPMCVPNVSEGDNINLDPMLTDLQLRPEPNVRLMSGSSMIDVGSNTAPALPLFDYLDEDRVMDGDGDGTATVDIGMHEYAGDTEPMLVDLSVMLTGTPATVVGGAEPVTYALAVANSDAADATSVSATLTLPAGATATSADASNGNCTISGVTVTCEWDTLAAAAGASATVVADLAAVTNPATVVAVVTVQSAEDDADTGNNSATVSTTVNPPAADLAIAIQGPASDPTVDEDVTYTVVVTNAGPSDQTNVTAAVALPDDVSLVSVSGASCDADDGSATCTLGALANGASANLTLVVRMPGEDTSFSLTATVSGDVMDDNSANDSASIRTNVVSTVRLIVKTNAGGGGALGLLGLLACGVVGAWRLLRRHGSGLAAVAALSVGIGVSAQALEERYVGASYGFANAHYNAADLTNDLDARGWTIDTVDVDDSDAAWKIFGGVRFASRLGAEIAWVDLGEIESSYGATVAPDQIGALLQDTGEVHESLADGVAITGLWHQPVGEAGQLFARLGWWRWDGETRVRVVSGATGRFDLDDSGSGAVLGLGVDLALNPDFALRLEWERYDVRDWVDTGWLSLRYRF